MSVTVRFAPSPTGYLHIGGARTALFNWLFARHCKGKFLLRIEDTDRERSTDKAIQAIFESLKWLELDWDGDPVFQFARAPRHAEVAQKLVEQGKAYYCYCSAEELETMRQEALAKGLPPRYNRYWRDRDPSEAPKDVKPVIRFKAPLEGTTEINDLVQGPIKLNNAQLDDMILLRADGTPTYMLSVVVDDHDMNITHVIRGDDHLTNAFRQHYLYQACGWETPQFAHIPLIHGPDGSKLSKRHGALGAEQYKEMGFLPEAMRNYLLRLGWAHGDDEIISTQEAIQKFTLEGIGKSPARFDMGKLLHLNGHYMRQSSNDRLVKDILPILKDWKEKDATLTDAQFDQGVKRIQSHMDSLKERAKTLNELAETALFYISAPQWNAQDEVQTLATKDKTAALKGLNEFLELVPDLLKDSGESAIETKIRNYCKQTNWKLGEFLYAVRIALVGRTASPSLFEVIGALGLEETQNRVNAYIDFLSKGL